MADAIFNTGEFAHAGHIASYAHHEQIPNAAVENQFHRIARIGAGQDRGQGLLSLGGGGGAALGVLVWVLWLPSGKTSVAFLEQHQGGVPQEAG